MKAKFTLGAGLLFPASIAILFSLPMYGYSFVFGVLVSVVLYCIFGVLMLTIFLAGVIKDFAFSSSMIHDMVVEWRNFYNSVHSLDDSEPLKIEHLKSLIPVPRNPFKDSVLLKQLGFYPELPLNWKGHEEQLQRAANATLSSEDIEDLDSLLSIQEEQAEKEERGKLEIELVMARLWLSAH